MTEPKVHDLKCDPVPFNAVWNLDKSYEIRNDDRNFQIGDRLLLREHDRSVNGDVGEYLGRAVRARITHKLAGGTYGLPDDTCALGFVVEDLIKSTPEGVITSVEHHRTPDALLRTWTGSEREAVLKHLLGCIPGPIPLDPVEAGAGFISLCSSEDVPADRCVSVVTACMSPFKPQRLVILATSGERAIVTETSGETFVDEMDTVPVEDRGWRFWRPKSRMEMVTRKVPKHSRTVRVETLTYKRSGWTVEGLFLGSHNVFHSLGKYPGDAFGPDGTLDLDMPEVEPGHHITLSVSHAWKAPVKFQAVLVGKFVKRKPKTDEMDALVDALRPKKPRSRK